MFYIIYRITNLVNNKIYIGCHQTKNLSDDYMGSGKALRRAINKYGLSSFKKEILYIFDNENDMYNKEKEIVNEDFLKRNDVYNLTLGGYGGWNYINNNRLNGFCKKEIAKLGRMLTDDILYEKYGDNFRSIAANLGDKGKKISLSIKMRLEDEEYRKDFYDNMRKIGLLACSEESIEKKKETFRIIEHQQGEKNSQYGSMWITNGIENRKIKKEEIIPENWYKGRKI